MGVYLPPLFSVILCLSGIVPGSPVFPDPDPDLDFFGG
nr:MAG: hypothetical protein [Microvirus sp.]